MEKNNRQETQERTAHEAAADEMPAADGGEKWRRPLPFALACLAALVLLVAAYSNHFDNGFHFDDFHTIVNNASLRSLSSISQYFTDATTFSSIPENSLYRPLLSTSYAIDYAVGDGQVRPFHYTQFAWLLALGAGLFFFYRRVLDAGGASRWAAYGALLATTLHCIHTANTETINYLSSRSSLAATLMVIIGFLVYLRWPQSRKTYLYLLPVLIGGLIKPLVVVFAPLLTAYMFLFEEDGSVGELLHGSGWRKMGRAFRRSIPAWLLGVGLYFFITAMDADSVRYAVISRWKYGMTQAFVWVHYFKLFLFPVGLTADADWKLVHHWYDTRFFAGMLFIGLLIYVVVRLSRRREDRPGAFGLLWFAIALLPSSSLFPLSEMYNEHRIFFPYVGLALTVGWLFGRLLQTAGRPLGGEAGRRWRPLLVAGLAVALLLAHAAGTYARNKVWKSEDTLWADVAKKSPTNGRGLMNYGLTFMRRGESKQALAWFQQAKLYTPNYPHLEINLGIVKTALGDEAGAEPHFQRAVQIDPNYAGGQFYFGRWLLNRERGPEALAHLEKAVELNPRAGEARNLLLRTYAAIGDEARLAALAEQTLQMFPGAPVALAYSAGRIPFPVAEETAQAYADLGWGRIQTSQWLDAAAIYRHALKLDADSDTSWNNLGWARHKLGFLRAAAPCYEKALDLNPGFDLARNNLASIRSQAG